ncbi:MAG: DegT/DnrJ/EryC1/StrS family aminotransferase [Mariprofundaceae bacterium]|nr:DegT/DnrJ/EryC1/StrS family aminotransferase [Mariprofundaceae bacterium]
MIPHARPSFDASFSQAVQAVVDSGYTACHTKAAQLEREICVRVGQDDAVAVDSGTSALMLAIRALSASNTIKKVGIPAYACASLLFAVRAAGCEAVCMDCNHDLRLDQDKAVAIAADLDALILVHPFGMLEPLVKESWPCPVIEDIAQAAGAMLDGQAVGSFGDVSIASFYATKPWGGAYGGMVMGDLEVCTEVRHMSNPDVTGFKQSYVGHHQLSDIHAALALVRLQCSKNEMQQRRQHMTWLDQRLPDRYVQSLSNRQFGSAYRYIIRAENNAETLIQHLRNHGIAASLPVQKPLNMATSDICDGAYQAWKDCISLPLLPTMSQHEYQQYERGLKVCFSC